MVCSSRVLARAVRVVPPRHDAHLLAVGDEVGMPQPERLPYPHPGFSKKNQQEAVPQVLARLDQGQHLFVGQGARQAARLA